MFVQVDIVGIEKPNAAVLPFPANFVKTVELVGKSSAPTGIIDRVNVFPGAAETVVLTRLQSATPLLQRQILKGLDVIA